jgi:hypothetical protein
MWLRFLDRGMKFAIIHEVAVTVRTHSQQATGPGVNLDKAYATGCALWRRHSLVSGVKSSVTRRRAAEAHQAAAMHFWAISPPTALRYLAQALRFWPFCLGRWQLLLRALFTLATVKRPVNL